MEALHTAPNDSRGKTAEALISAPPEPDRERPWWRLGRAGYLEPSSGSTSIRSRRT